MADELETSKVTLITIIAPSTVRDTILDDLRDSASPATRL
jgi:hypothetical protein